MHFIQCQKTTDIYRKKKMKYKPYRLCCVRYTYDESRLETKRFENCMFCMSQDSRTLSKSNEYIKTLLLMSTTEKVLHTDEPKMINTTHLLERSTISFYQPSSIGSKKNRKRNNQNRSIKRPAMHVMNRVFKIKIVYPKDILPKYKCVCV